MKCKFTENVREIVIVWSTIDDANGTIVQYSLNGDQFETVGESNLFVDGGHKKHQQFIHKVCFTYLISNTVPITVFCIKKVTLGNLKADARYKYRCGSDLGWSDEFWFRTPPEDENDWAPHFAIFGDMGNENAQSLGRLQVETQRDVYDAILHVGDFAYDMDSENAAVGDQYMRQIESIAAYVPYMVCVGNHEEK